MGPGFFFAGGGNNSVELYCYKGFFLSSSRFVVQARNSGGVSANLIDFNLSSALSSGDTYIIRAEWTQDGTDTDLTVTIHQGKTQLGTGSFTGNTYAGVQAGGTWGLLYQGNSGNIPNAGVLFSRVLLAKYNPVTIGSVTCNATTQMEPGMTRNITVTVLDDGDNPAAGQVVTSSYTGDSGLSTNANRTTDAEGKAVFALVADGGMIVGDTGTFTFAVGGQDAETAVSIVSAISGGGGGGGRVMNHISSGPERLIIGKIYNFLNFAWFKVVSAGTLDCIAANGTSVVMTVAEDDIIDFGISKLNAGTTAVIDGYQRGSSL
jgi:hypothetical protein